MYSLILLWALPYKMLVREKEALGRERAFVGMCPKMEK